MLCLILLIVEGGVLLSMHPSFLGLSPVSSSTIGNLWHSVMKLVAVPLCLFLLLFSKRDIIRFCVWLWGIFVSLLSIFYIFMIDSISPSATQYGKLFTILVMITAVALTLFESIDLFELPVKVQKAKEEGAPPEPAGDNPAN